MIKLEGKLINVFTQEGGTNKKASRLTSVTKIQVMGAVELPNGDVRHNYLRWVLITDGTMNRS